VGWKTVGFDPADPKATLAELPQSPAVFALYGVDSRAEPYIGRTPNLCSRLERLLQPSRSIRAACISRASFAESTGSSPAPNSNRYFSSLN
jgi:excinuclease ABC subunit C